MLGVLCSGGFWIGLASADDQHHPHLCAAHVRNIDSGLWHWSAYPRFEATPRGVVKNGDLPYLQARGVYSPGSVYKDSNNEYGVRLLEAIFEHYDVQSADPQRALVLGSGTGIDATTLTRVFSSVDLVGVDLLPAAVNVARANAALYGVSARAQFATGDVRHPLGFLSRGRDAHQAFDLICFSAPRNLSSRADKTKKEFADSNRFDLTGTLLVPIFKNLDRLMAPEGSFFLMTDQSIGYALPPGFSSELAAGPFPWRDPWLSRPLPSERDEAFAIHRIFRTE